MLDQFKWTWSKLSCLDFCQWKDLWSCVSTALPAREFLVPSILKTCTTWSSKTPSSNSGTGTRDTQCWSACEVVLLITINRPSAVCNQLLDKMQLRQQRALHRAASISCRPAVAMRAAAPSWVTVLVPGQIAGFCHCRCLASMTVCSSGDVGYVCRAPNVESIQGVRQEVVDAISKATKNCLNDTSLDCAQRKKVSMSTHSESPVKEIRPRCFVITWMFKDYARCHGWIVPRKEQHNAWRTSWWDHCFSCEVTLIRLHLACTGVSTVWYLRLWLWWVKVKEGW